MPQVGFEPTIPVFERAKTVHAFDHAPIVIGSPKYHSFLFVRVGFVYFLFYNKHELNFVIAEIGRSSLFCIYCTPFDILRMLMRTAMSPQTFRTGKMFL
jgi:hypothetical protein